MEKIQVDLSYPKSTQFDFRGTPFTEEIIEDFAGTGAEVSIRRYPSNTYITWFDGAEDSLDCEWSVKHQSELFPGSHLWLEVPNHFFETERETILGRLKELLYERES